MARRLGAAIVGGCCGTGPGHIAALVEVMAGAPAPVARPRRIFALASAFTAMTAAGSGKAGLFVIDERSNAAGSAAFKAIVKSGDFEAAARFVVDRAARGAGRCRRLGSRIRPRRTRRDGRHRLARRFGYGRGHLHRLDRS